MLGGLEGDVQGRAVREAHGPISRGRTDSQNMNMNFFEWLRDGVRQSVILGVSDAVEQIGVPETDQEVQPTLAALLGNETVATTKPRRKTTAASGRKRLGKSLKDMNTTK